MGGGLIYFAFILVLISILVLLRLYKKRSESAEEIEGPVVLTKRDASAGTSDAENHEPALESNQQTIYEYTCGKPVWICPDCDAENRSEGQQCVICGYRYR